MATSDPFERHMTRADRDRAGRTPLHYAVIDDPVGLDYTAAQTDPWIKAENARSGREFRIGNTLRLLAEGADVNAADFDGLTPLHAAASADSANVVEVLLEFGAQVNATSGDGITPTYNAVRNTSPAGLEILQLLLENGADPTVEMSNGSSALKLAKRLQSMAMLRVFVHHGYE
jgi:ankyrin repeat protein